MNRQAVYKRRARLISAAVILGVGLLAALAHAPIARSHVLSFLLAQLRTYGIDGGADGLDYNLFTLDFRVRNVVLRTAGHRDVPFFAADQVHVDLSWAVLAGTWSFDAVEILRPRIVVVRADDGTLNLPAFQGQSGRSSLPSAVRVGRLVVRDLSVAWTDAPRAIGVDVRGLSLALSPSPEGAAGPLTLAGPARFRWGARHTVLTALDGRLLFDGTRLTLADLRVDAPEGTLRVNGRLGPLTAEPALDLSYTANLDLARLASWSQATPPVSGVVACTGHLGGTVLDPQASLAVSGGRLRWAGLRDGSAEATVHLTPTAADVTSMVLRAAGGELTARGRIAFGEAPASELRLEWRDLDATAMAAALAAPVPGGLSGTLRGRLDVQWTVFSARAVSLAAENRTATLDPDAPLATEGVLRFTGAAGRWKLDIDQRLGGARVTGSASARASGGALGASALSGQLTVTAGNLARAWETCRAVRLNNPALTGLGGEARADISLGGTLEAPQFRAALEGRALHYGAAGLASLRAQVSGSSRSITLDAADLATGDNRAQASGRLVLQTGELAARVDAHLADLPALTGDLPAVLRPEGSIALTAAISGRWLAPQVHATLDSRHLKVAGQLVDVLTADLRLDGDTVRADSITIAQAGGTLLARGEYRPRGGLFSLTARGRNLLVQPIPAAGPGGGPLPLTAKLDIDFNGSGSLADPHGTGQLVMNAASWGDHAIGRVETDVRLADRALHLEARVPDAGTVLAGSLDLRAFGRFVVRGTVEHGDLGTLAGRLMLALPVPIAGSLSAGIQAAGDLAHLPSATATLDLRRLDVKLGALPIRLPAPGRLAYAAGEIRAENLSLQLGRTELRMDGRAGAGGTGVLTATLAGRLEDLDALCSLLPAPAADLARSWEAAGAIDTTLTARGTIDRPAISADFSVDDGQLRPPGLPRVTGVVLQGDYRDGMLDLKRLAGTWQQATLEASGRVPAAMLERYLPRAYLETLPRNPGPARLSARIAPVTPAVLAPWLDESTLARLQATLAVSLSLEADALSLERLRGESVLDRADVTVAGIPLSQQRPTRVAITPGRAQIVDWAWGGADNRLMLGGSVQLGPPPRLDLTLDASLDLRVLTLLVPVGATAGRAELALQVCGPASAPDIDGRVRVSGGEFRLAEPRIILAGLAGTIELAKDRLTTTDFAGTLNGSQVRLSGELLDAGLRPTSGLLSMTGRGLSVELRGLRGEANADLTLGLAGDRLALSGDVNLERSAFQQPLSLTGGLLFALQAQPAAGIAAAPSLLDATTLNVRLTTAADLAVDNNYGRLDVGADLRVVGTVGHPSLVGRTTVREGGEIYLGGNTYRVVNAGSIDFANPARIEPRLDLSAVTRVETYDITLTMKGTPDRLETWLRSDDSSLTQSDIVSLLLTGRPLGEGGGLQAAVSGPQVLGYLSGEFLGGAGRAVGLDTIRIQRGLPDVSFDAGLIATETDPGSRLTFAKDVGGNLRLIFSQSLNQSGGQTWIVSYAPRRNVEVRVVSDDNGDRSYELRHDLSFGGPSPTAGRSTTARAAQVAAIRFTGDPGVSAAELRGQLKVSAGDPFDFSRWQQDRDRLEAFFHGRGYREVRIDARRSTETGSGPGPAPVILEYEVHPGPRTVLTVEGYDLPAGVREKMDAVWARAVFDDFLLADLKSIARSYLMSEGYLRAEVTAEVVPQPREDRKQVVVQIRPGLRSTRREVVFRGNREIGSGRLEELLATRDPTASVWVDPALLGPQVLALYRDEGYLAAAVGVGTIEFDGPTATLPVSIDEGPAFRISAIRVQGAQARAASAALSALGLEAGQILSHARVVAARRRLEESYQRDGFNDVRVELRSDTGREPGAVEVTVVVHEGPRQVLRDIVIIGGHRTSPDVIRRALTLEIGDPVDLGAWSRARARLSDTRVFRRVDIQAEPVQPAAKEITTGEQPMRARITLEEWAPLRLRYGLQVRDEQKPAADQRTFGLGFAGDLTYRNLFGRAASAGLSGRLTRDTRTARTYLTVPTFFGLPVRSNLFLSRSREELGAETSLPYVTDKIVFTAEQRVGPAGGLELAYSYNFEQNHTFDLHPDPNDPLAFDVTANVARLGAIVLHDSRDDLVNATRGWFHSSSLDYGAAALGSDLHFVKYVLQQYYYRSLVHGIVVASAARLGMAKGFGQQLIPSERFFAGGGTSVRGYAPGALSPHDFLGPIGGNALLVLNEEMRFPIFRMVGGVAFFDAGRAFPSVSDLSLADLGTSVGFGLRLDTRFALLRADFGVPLERQPGDKRGRWFLSIGQAF